MTSALMSFSWSIVSLVERLAAAAAVLAASIMLPMSSVIGQNQNINSRVFISLLKTPKSQILSSFTNPFVIPNLYCCYFSSVEYIF